MPKATKSPVQSQDSLWSLDVKVKNSFHHKNQHSMSSNESSLMKLNVSLFYGVYFLFFLFLCKHLEGRVMLISSTMPNKVKIMLLLDASITYGLNEEKSVKICMMKT